MWFISKTKSGWWNLKSYPEFKCKGFKGFWELNFFLSSLNFIGKCISNITPKHISLVHFLCPLLQPNQSHLVHLSSELLLASNLSTFTLNSGIVSCSSVNTPNSLQNSGWWNQPEKRIFPTILTKLWPCFPLITVCSNCKRNICRFAPTFSSHLCSNTFPDQPI